MEDLYLEYVTGYVFYHYMLVDELQQGLTSRQDAISKAQKNAKAYTDSRDGVVCKKYNIPLHLLGPYLKHYSNDR